MFSVHCPLYCTFGFSRNTTVTNLTQSENHDDGRIHYYEKMIWNASIMQIFDSNFPQLIRSFYDILDTVSAMEMLDSFITLIKSSCPTTVRGSYMSKGDNPCQPNWWSDECAIAKNEKYNRLRIFRVSNHLSDLVAFHEAKKIFKRVCKRAKINNQYKSRRIPIDSGKNLQKFWKTIKSFLTKKNINTITNISSDEWMVHFQSLCYKNIPESRDESITLQHIRHDLDNDYLNTDITEDEITRALSQVHSNRSPGPDGIGIDVLKLV